MQLASAWVSAEGTYSVGTQCAAPAEQQLGRLDGLMSGGRLVTQLPPPPLDDASPLLPPSPPAALSSRPAFSSGVPSMPAGEQPA